MNGPSLDISVPSDEVTLASDVCALPLVRRLAAMLDRDPMQLQEGDPLPRGWYPLLFNVPTRQSQLRPDGSADLGVHLPEMGLPRLMLGGRQARFEGDLPIGARVRRETRRGPVQLKQGRSGRFALVNVEHRIFVEGQANPALIEHLDYVLRPATQTAANPGAGLGNAPAAVTPASTQPDTAHSRILVPDPRLLFRYSAITDNPHRIHYDAPYALQSEGYPALVVNGTIPAMFLLEMFRQLARREPAHLASRNMAPMLCGQPLRLTVEQDGESWRLWAQTSDGQITYDARAH